MSFFSGAMKDFSLAQLRRVTMQVAQQGIIVEVAFS